MMTTSNALSAGQAETYYQKDYTNKTENYYSEKGEVNGHWYGRLAEEWELRGEVTSEQYARLVADKTRTPASNSFAQCHPESPSITTARRSQRANIARVGMRPSALLSRFRLRLSLATTNE